MLELAEALEACQSREGRGRLALRLERDDGSWGSPPHDTFARLALQVRGDRALRGLRRGGESALFVRGTGQLGDEPEGARPIQFVLEQEVPDQLLADLDALDQGLANASELLLGEAASGAGHVGSERESQEAASP